MEKEEKKKKKKKDQIYFYFYHFFNPRFILFIQHLFFDKKCFTDCFYWWFIEGL